MGGGGVEPSNRAGVSHVCRQQSIVKKLQFTDAQNLNTFDWDDIKAGIEHAATLVSME